MCRAAINFADQSNTAWMLDNVGDSYGKTGDYLQALEQHQQAVLIYRQTNEQSYLASSCNSMSEVYRSMSAAMTILYFLFDN